MKALVVVAKKGYQDQELSGTLAGLTDKRYDITIASTEEGTCEGKFGGTQVASLALKDVDVSGYDKIAFIGGPGAAALADDAHAKRIAQETYGQGKVLGAICIAPTILARAGVLKGKNATVWDNEGAQAAILVSEGAKYTGDDVTVDGKIITANGPAAAQKFGKVLADA